MNQIKTLLTLGIAFMGSGATFLIIGLTTHLAAMWAIGPALLVLGVVFLAISVSRKGSRNNQAVGPGKEA